MGLLRLPRFDRLRAAPVVENSHLMNAGDRASRGAGFFREKFAAEVLGCVFGKRNARIAALLRTIVNQPVLADIEVSRTGTAPPFIFSPSGNIVLEGIYA